MVEEIIGILLNSLSDTATVVRWNAAKQLGRVAERLDKENGQYIAEQILGNVKNHLSYIDEFVMIFTRTWDDGGIIFIILTVPGNLDKSD